MRVPGRGCLGDVGLQVLVEVPVFHVLDQHAQGLLPRAHAHHLHDVGVPKARQDLNFALEVTPAQGIQRGLVAAGVEEV